MSRWRLGIVLGAALEMGLVCDGMVLEGLPVVVGIPQAGLG